MPDPVDVFKKPEEQQQEEQQATLATSQTQSGDVFSDQLKSIQAEDGRQKYDTVPKALEALAHSQTFIPTLQAQLSTQEQEITQLREELAKHKGVQEVVDSLTQHQRESQEGNPSEPKFGEEEVAKLIANTLDKRSQEQTLESNANKVNDTLVSAFGDKAQEMVQLKAKELNTTPEALGQLASTSPDMVLALFQQKQTSTSVTNSSYNLGFNKPLEEPLKRPEKSLLAGASLKDQTEFMRQIKAEVYRKHGIEE